MLVSIKIFNYKAAIAVLKSPYVAELATKAFKLATVIVALIVLFAVSKEALACFLAYGSTYASLTSKFPVLELYTNISPSLIPCKFTPLNSDISILPE